MKTNSGRFFWKLFLGNALLLALSLSTCLWLIFLAYDRQYEEELKEELRAFAAVVREGLPVPLAEENADALARYARSLGSTTGKRLRITFILANGVVVGDSEADPARMDSHSNRPEIRQALAEGWGASSRWSHTVSQRMNYAALRAGDAKSPDGVVRVSVAAVDILTRTRSAKQLWLLLGLVVIASAAALALGLARMWSRPIASITQVADSLARGDLSARAPVSGTDEIAILAQSLNRMRERLARQLESATRQRRTLEFLVAQLTEGVVVAGPDGRIALINPTAASLLRLPLSFTGGAEAVKGLTLEACVPQHELQEMLQPRKNDEQPEVDERRIDIKHADGDVALLARASNIIFPVSGDSERFDSYRPEGESRAERASGRVLVLTDITELTRNLRVKTDFVANASHELRTPLAAVRGAVETLLSMNVASDTDNAVRMLQIIDRHTRRLTAMVSDLLELSRIESDSARFKVQKLQAKDLLDNLHQRFAERLSAKAIRWDVEMAEGGVSFYCNLHLLNLVCDNLVDNAIKFTPEGGRVTIAVKRREDAVTITVSDTGCGIPYAEQQRVFERFYQVGAARSGPQRGTGLGLAIVRHALSALNGAVQLESEPGQWTRVRVTLPTLDEHLDANPTGTDNAVYQ